MCFGFDRGAVRGRLDRVRVSADIAEHRMVDPICELRRTFSVGGADDDRGADQADHRHREPWQCVRPRIHVALLETSPCVDAGGAQARDAAPTPSIVRN